MKRIISVATSVVGALLLSASAHGSTLPAGHVLWDLTAEQDTYVVGQTIPSQDSLGDPNDFTVQTSDMDPLAVTATTVQDWTDQNTGQVMPGKAILMRRDASHTSASKYGEIQWQSGGAGYDSSDPMVTGRIKVSCDVMIDSSTNMGANTGWKAEGYVNVMSWSTANGTGMKNSVGFQMVDEEIVDYDPVGLNVEPKTWANFPVELGADFYGYAHHVEMDIDYDAQTYQVWVDGNTNGSYVLSAPPTADAWPIPTLYRFSLPYAVPAGAQHIQYVFDNLKAEVVPEPASLVLLGLGFCGLLIGRRTS